MSKMEISFGGLVGSMFISGFGFVFFRYGRKKSRPLFWLTGLVMMIYPYFVSDFLWMIGIAALLCAGLYWGSKQGY